MTHFHKTPNIKFKGNPSSRSALIQADRRKDGPTDRETDMTKVLGAFREYVNASRK